MNMSGIQNNTESFPLLLEDINDSISQGSDSINTNDKFSEEIFYSTQQQKNLFKKISLFILPFAVLICGFSYLDRTNVSYGAMSMLHDLNMSCREYGFGSGILLLGYSIFQIPSSMIMVRVGAPIYLGVMIIIWGALTAAFAAVKGKVGFFVLRFVIGAFQAGSFPGVWYYITLFYPGSHLTVPFAIIDLGIGIAQVIAPALAVGFLALKGVGGLNGWQWIFIGEGIPTIIFGVIVLAVLPTSLDSAKMILPAEKRWLQYKIGSINSSSRGLEFCSNGEQSAFMLTLKNSAIWHLSLIRFFKDMTSQGIFYWLPMVIYAMLHEGQKKHKEAHTCGKGSFDTQDTSEVFAAILLTIFPYGFAVTAMMLIGHHSQKVGESRLHGGIPCIIGGIGLIGLPYVQSYSYVAGFFCLTVSMAGYLTANPCVTNLVCAHSCKKTLHISLPFTDSIGIAGGFMGTYIFGLLSQWTHSYALPSMFLGVVLLLSGILLVFVQDPVVKEKEVQPNQQVV